MKKLLKSIAVFFVAVSLTSAAPTSIPTTKAPLTFKVGMYNVQNSHVLKVFIEKVLGENVKLELKGKDGSVFFSKYLGKKETKKGFNIDMSQLPSDYYTLMVTNGEEKFVKKLDLRSAETLVLDKKITF